MCHTVFIINIHAESKQSRRHVAYALLRAIWFRNKIPIKTVNHIPCHTRLKYDIIKLRCTLVLVFPPPRSWNKAGALFSILRCEQLFQPCGRNGRSTRGGFGEDRYNIHCTCSEKGDCNKSNPMKTLVSLLCWCFSTVTGLLQRWGRGEMWKWQGWEGKALEFCQTLLKEMHAIKLHSQLIGQCYRW